MLITVSLAAAAAAQMLAVRVELTVNQEGAISHCTVLEINANAPVATEPARKLADDVCQGLLLHGKFEPQRDASGKPIEFKTTTTVRFQLPDEPSAG